MVTGEMDFSSSSVEGDIWEIQRICEVSGGVEGFTSLELHVNVVPTFMYLS